MNVIQPWQLLLVSLAGWINRHQLDVIAYIQEENRILKSKLNGLSPRRLERSQGEETLGPMDSVCSRLHQAKLRAVDHTASLGLQYARPDCELLAVILPSQPSQ